MEQFLGVAVVVIAVIVFGLVVNAFHAGVDGVFNFVDRLFERKESKTRTKERGEDGDL